MGSLHHSKWCVRRERENHTRALGRLAGAYTIPPLVLYRLQPETHRKTPRVLPHLTTCAAIVVYSIPNAGVHRRVGEQVSGTVRLCDPAPGEDELGFWEALCATAQIRHHGSSSVQVGRCYSSSYSSPSAADRRQHRHQHCRTHNS